MAKMPSLLDLAEQDRRRSELAAMRAFTTGMIAPSGRGSRDALTLPPLRQAAGTPTAGYDMRAPVRQAAGTPTAGYDMGMPAQPASAPMAAPMQAAPAPAPQQQRGLLGGFFGPEGRDARARLAIGLEGLTMRPNQALIGQLQQGIERRETAAQKNATAEWLRSRGREDLAAAMEGGLPAADALRIAMQPADPMAAINLQKAQIELERLRHPQNEIREVDGRILSISPNGDIREIYGAAPDPMAAINLQKAQLELERLRNQQPEFRRATPEEAAAYGAESGQFGPDGRFYAIDVPQGMTIESDGAGGFRMVQGAGVGAGGNRATEGQLAGGGYLQRMTAAEARLRDIERKAGSIAIPIEKTIFMDTGLEGYALTPTEQQIAQAQRDWVRSKLRKESGAVIGTEEMAAEIRTYFPQPGESAETARQKAEARRLAERQMEITAGPAAAQAGAISPEYAPPVTMGELGGLGIGTGMSTQSQPVVIDGVTIRKVN